MLLAIFTRAADYSRQLDHLASTVSIQLHVQLLDQLRFLKDTSQVVANRSPGSMTFALPEGSEPLLKESLVIIKTIDPATSSPNPEAWIVDSQNSATRMSTVQREIFEKLSLLSMGIGKRGSILPASGATMPLPLFKEEFLFASTTTISPSLQVHAFYPLRLEEILLFPIDTTKDISAQTGNVEVRQPGDLILLQDHPLHGANFLIGPKTRQILVGSSELQVRVNPLPLPAFLLHLCTDNSVLPFLLLWTGLLSLSLTRSYQKEKVSLQQANEAQKQLVATLDSQVKILTEGHPLGIFIVDAKGALLHRNTWLTEHLSVIANPLRQHWRHLLPLDEQKVADAHWRDIEQGHDAVDFATRIYSGSTSATCTIKLIPIRSGDDVFVGATGFISLTQPSKGTTATAVIETRPNELTPSPVVAVDPEQHAQNNMILEGLINIGETLTRLEQNSTVLKSELASIRSIEAKPVSPVPTHATAPVNETNQTAPVDLTKLHRQLRFIRRQLAKTKTHTHSTLLEDIVGLARNSRPRTAPIRRYQHAINKRLEKLEEMIEQLLAAKVVPTEIQIVDSLENVVIRPKTPAKKRDKNSSSPTE